MSVELSQMQIDKFRGLGKAAKDLAADYKAGKGPDPQSGATYRNGVPHCTWGQLLDKAGFKATPGMNDTNNLGVFGKYIGEPKVANAKSVGGTISGLMADKHVEYDISKIAAYGTKIMQANDPATSAAARKAATWKLLEELSEEIEKTFGEPEQENLYSFEGAAQQHLENLIMGVD